MVQFSSLLFVSVACFLVQGIESQPKGPNPSQDGYLETRRMAELGKDQGTGKRETLDLAKTPKVRHVKWRPDRTRSKKTAIKRDMGDFGMRQSVQHEVVEKRAERLNGPDFLSENSRWKKSKGIESQLKGPSPRQDVYLGMRRMAGFGKDRET